MVNGDTTEKPAYLVQDYVAEDEKGRNQHFDLKNLIVHISPNASETTAGDGDAAIAIEGTISLEFLNEGLNRPLGTGVDFPGIGIVAVLAAHGATLEKDDKPHTGTIYCTETLGGMDITVHSLHLVVEGTGNHFVLLLLGQSDEVNRIPADTDCELRVFLGMCLGVQQCFLGENVNVQMVTALLTTVRGSTGGLSVDHIGGNGQNRGGGNAVPVGVVLADLLHELVDYVAGNVIDPIIIVAELGEVALDLVIHGQAVLVTKYLDFRILNGRQGVRNNGQSGNTGGKPAGHVLVVQCHLDFLVAVLVVHVMDDVQGVHIDLGQPLHHRIVFFLLLSGKNGI